MILGNASLCFGLLGHLLLRPPVTTFLLHLLIFIHISIIFSLYPSLLLIISIHPSHLYKLHLYILLSLLTLSSSIYIFIHLSIFIHIYLKGNYKLTDQIFQKGIRRLAEPKDLLSMRFYIEYTLWMWQLMWWICWYLCIVIITIVCFLIISIHLLINPSIYPFIYLSYSHLSICSYF